MKTLVKNEFRQTRKTLLIWLGIMLLLCGFCYFELLSLKDSLDEMARTVGQFPRLIMIMFGVKGDLTTALGWYACIYFWEGLLAFAYAISLGLSCVAREKKFGTSEYLFTKPVERKTIVLAKVIVSAVNLLVFALYLPLTILIPSSSGLATLSIPIVAPLGKFAGVGGDLVVTAFQSASGLVNIITPTAAVVMGALALGHVPYDRWVKYVWKLILWFLLLALAFLVAGVLLG